MAVILDFATRRAVPRPPYGGRPSGARQRCEIVIFPGIRIARHPADEPEEAPVRRRARTMRRAEPGPVDR